MTDRLKHTDIGNTMTKAEFEQETLHVIPGAVAGDELYFDGTAVSHVTSPIFNVKRQPFNAKGDGVTDDTAAIQAAINTAATAGGGVVYFPHGTYLITSELLVSVQHNVALVGSYYGATLKQGANAGAYTHSSLIYVTASNYFYIQGLKLLGRNTKTWSTTLTANANGGDLTIAINSATGIIIGDALGIRDDSGASPHLTTVDDIAGLTVTLHDAVPAGIPFATTGAAVYAMDDVIHLLHIANSFAATVADCLFLNGWGGAKSTGTHERAMLSISQNSGHLVTGNKFINGGNWGCQIGGGASLVRIIGNYFAGMRIESGLKLYNVTRVVVSGNQFSANAEAAISTESAAAEVAYCVIVDNNIAGGLLGIEVYNANRLTIRGNHIESPTSYDGIAIMSGSGKHVISGNVITSAARHGILVQASDCQLIGNQVHNAVAAGIKLYATGTLDANRNLVQGNVVIDADNGDTDTYGGIEVEAIVGRVADRNVIRGNVAIASVGGAKTTYGIMVRNVRSTRTLVEGNVLTPYNVAPVYDAGTLTVYQRTAWIPASAFYALAGSPVVGTIGNSPAILFDPDAEEAAVAMIALPDDYLGGNIVITPRWAINTNAGDVIIRTLAAVVSNAEVVNPAWTQDTGSQAITVPSVALKRFDSTTLAVPESEISALTDHILIDVVRKGNLAGDTAVGDAGLLGVELTYAANIVN